MTTYKNPWHKLNNDAYGPANYNTDATPVAHAGALIYERYDGRGQEIVWDVVVDDVCLAQRAGLEGAKRSAQDIQVAHTFLEKAHAACDLGRREEALLLYQEVRDFCHSNYLSSMEQKLQAWINQLRIRSTANGRFYRQTRLIPGDASSPPSDIVYVNTLDKQIGAISHWSTKRYPPTEKSAIEEEKWHLTGKRGAIDLWFDTQETAKEEAEKLWPGCTFENADEAPAFETLSMGI